ncbi:MAG: PP2C family serine/threonine-protein phosphatase [bacterium]|nr:PP2C family serine/threonine-protein phosphatase [bacterium]
MTEWKCVGASVIGNDHVRREKPCQDASAAIAAPRPAGIVCDGAGSAVRSHDGARAAVREFGIFLAGMEPMFAQFLDDELMPSDVAQGCWRHAATCLGNALCAAKKEVALREDGTKKPEDYDFTLAAVVVGKAYTGFVQVGDGAIIVREGGDNSVVFDPEKGQFANQTKFLTEKVIGTDAFKTTVIPTFHLNGMLLMSDGPQPLMIDLGSQRPGEIVNQMIDKLSDGGMGREDVIRYLSDSRWFKDPRGGDDKSIVVFARGEKDGDMDPQPMKKDSEEKKEVRYELRKRR